MEGHCHRQNVEIVLDMKSDLYKRLAEKAVEEEIQIETLVDFLVGAGISRHIKNRLDALERAGENHGSCD